MSWGVYVHVPYCARICPYCDFNVHHDRAPPWAALAAALRRELDARRPAFPAAPATTLYFGGGTPSLAPPDFVADIVAAVRASAGLTADAEVTLEANPTGLEAARLAGYRAAGVTRLSLGWQSTHDRLLKVLGRQHDAAGAAQALAAARRAGFAAISLDLIFAVPGQTLACLDADLERLVAAAPEHVSLYALTYAPGTPFHRRRRAGTLTPVSEAREVVMMDRIDAALHAADFAQYEVSNYARPGHTSRHNQLYWQGHPYLGLGPGAHSFWRLAWQAGERWENVRDPAGYLAAWRAPRPPGRPNPTEPTASFVEALTPAQLTAERMMCGLRQPTGIDLAAPPCAEAAPALAQGVATALAHGWAERRGTHLCPTATGLRRADALAALFF